MLVTHLALCELVRRRDRKACLVVEEASADEHVSLVHHVAAAAGHVAANRRARKMGVSINIKIKAHWCIQIGHTLPAPPAPPP